MQTIFAYRQSRQANYGMAQDSISEAFRPDLNSMEIQNPAELKEQGKEAMILFNENFLEKGFICQNSSFDHINEVVTEEIREYHQRNEQDYYRSKKNMVLEVDRVYDRYLSILKLIIDFAKEAENDKKRDHANYLSNPFIQALRGKEQLEVIFLRKHINWDDSVVRQWFKTMLRNDEFYSGYNTLNDPDEKDHQEWINYLVKNILFKNEVINTFFEEMDLNWDEDKAIVKSLTVKTVKLFYTDGEIELQDISYNWEDDKAFFVDLFTETSKAEDDYAKLIAEKTKNWDIERIAMTDRIAIEMAIAEMINFSSIPVKVTINEYIELVKKYSTPKSKQFINGVLDVIAEELSDKGVIKKSGRGLIDNK